MKQPTRKQKGIVNAMAESAGRFFGLETVKGEVFNAQFRGESPNYVTVYDRNDGADYKLAKTSLAHFRLGDTQL
jgi:hypothetical protein